MKTVVVRYKVRPEAVAENERLIRKVFEQLAVARPQGLRYQSVKLADGVSFMHVATVQARDASPLPALPAFRDFVAGIRDRCVEPPSTSEVEVLGTYAG
jgi:hypothetical protein